MLETAHNFLNLLKLRFDLQAVTSAAVMSDRYCLWTNSSRIFSAWDVATCMSDNPNMYGSYRFLLQ